MVYRVIIELAYRELWFDFVEYGQACVFAEAAKLKNVPNNPSKYGADQVEKVYIRILTLEEQETQLKTFAEEVERIKKEVEREDVSQYAE